MTELPLRDDLIGQVPYGAPTDAVPVRLNVNEIPYPPPDDVVAAMAKAIQVALVDANRYPDREVVDLRAALADYLGGGISSENVWPANGSNEVMHQIFSAFGGPCRTALSFAPTYSMYPIYARDTFTRYTTLPRNPDFSLAPADISRAVAELTPSLVVVASPNNPTGTVSSHDEIRALHEQVADHGVLIVDEAYVEFSRVPSAVALVPELPRLIVTRTLSKAFGLAGLRIGYAVTSPAIVDALRLVRLPYHLSVIDQVAATAALQHHGRLLAPVGEVVQERERQAAWLAQRGIGVAASQGNFLLVGPLLDSHLMFERLLALGVLVRETSVPGHLRVSIGTPAENEAFRLAFEDIVNQDPRATRERRT